MTKPTRRKASQSAIDVDAKELVQGDGAGTQIIPLALLPPDPADGADKPFATFFIQRKNQGSNFKKPNPLVHNKPHAVMTVMQQKLTNIMLRHAQQNQPVEPATWKISVEEMLRLLNVRTRNYEHIEKTIDELMSIKLRLDVFEEKGLAKHFAVVFPYAKLYAGEITFKIESKALLLLGDSPSYTSLDLLELSALSKVCSVPLFEFCSRYLGIGSTRRVPWQDLRDMLVASKSIPNKAQQWSTFKERYLDPAIKDINASTKLYIEVETERYKTKVTNLRFHVSRQKLALEMSAANSNSETKKHLVDAMQALGLVDKAIYKLLSTYSEEQIEGALKHTKWRVTESKLRKLTYPSRYFLSSLKSGHYQDFLDGRATPATAELFPVADGLHRMPPASVQEAEAAPPAARKPRAATTKSEARNGLNKGRAKLIAAVEKQRILDLKVILGELEKPALQAIYDEYNATLGVEANRIKIGRNRAGVLPSFHAWYARKLWGEEVTDAEIVAMMERMLSA
ncbi:replication initiation protein [Comamonas endophytica]|uniref:Replication initiation protein n=2 Tax=Comamonas endophytica TaxID=2949090 RepID=A0ABY6GEN2_9BURK|nr:replication initiation protein [Acidovorax sp. 5MLIR]MCD2514297.1 replication initiation protein [Acidovorax sp. D4N7]UYG53547.1 replication initiation protein [Acidovorax sp. 5MLIR]